MSTEPGKKQRKSLKKISYLEQPPEPDTYEEMIYNRYYTAIKDALCDDEHHRSVKRALIKVIKEALTDEEKASIFISERKKK